MNKVILVGNLGRSPELRHTRNDKVVVNFSIAVNEGFGESKKTQWFRIVVWNKLAENCAQYLGTGSKVLVSGRLNKNEYEKDGVWKKSYEIVAQEVEFLNKVKKEEDTGWDVPPPDDKADLQMQEDIPQDELPF